MPKANNRISLHRFHSYIAISFDDTNTIYLESQDGKQLSEQLKQFFHDIQSTKFTDSTLNTRIIYNGQTSNE